MNFLFFFFFFLYLFILYFYFQEQLNEDELNQAFSNLGLNPGSVGVGLDGNSGGGGGADNPDILPVMQNMMKTLLSKEVLYPSLKEISQKVSKFIGIKFNLKIDLFSQLCC